LLDGQPFHFAYSNGEALGVSPFNHLESFGRIAGYERFSLILDPSRVNGLFATGSDGNLPRVIAHSQGSRER
jgi:hypothetical protein